MGQHVQLRALVHAVGVSRVSAFPLLALLTSLLHSGYKESGIGRECGQAALENYTEIKTVYLNMGMDPIPIGPNAA